MSRVPAACRSLPIAIIAGCDGLTKAFLAHVVPCKRTSHGYAERALAHNVLSTSHQKVILLSDQDRATSTSNTKLARTSQLKSCTKKVQSETATPTVALSEPNRVCST